MLSGSEDIWQICKHVLLCTLRWQGPNWSVILVQLYSPGHFATTCTVVFILIVFEDLLVQDLSTSWE